ncbi:hypothetical protein [Microbacterium sp. A1-JK]|uniref:hypothetical protein n=1 Tax=Microbacterium sp. A1-JK TaxID=3177516 RepID=UPI00388A5F25
MTPDLDVLLLNPDPRIMSIAEAMADELNLDPAWLNSRAFALRHLTRRGRGGAYREADE